jgi:hypothetical protein
MNEVLRILQGDSWAAIYIRKQNDKALTGLLVLAVAGLGVAALLSKSASA